MDKNEVLKILETAKDKNGEVPMRLVRQAFEKLPEPCEVDPRADVYYLAEKIGIHRLYALVVELRGEPEPCKDAVSRHAAINALRTCQTYLFDTHDKDKKISLEDAEYGIEQLPPVEPKVIACGSGELDVEESDLALDGHALMKAFYDTPEGLQTWSYAWYLFNHAKLAKPKPKRGRWIRQSDPDSKLFGWFICSECGAFIGEEPPYCSNCGADMRGGK